MSWCDSRKVVGVSLKTGVEVCGVLEHCTYDAA